MASGRDSAGYAAELSEEELKSMTGGEIVLQQEKVTGANASPKLFREALSGTGHRRLRNDKCVAGTTNDFLNDKCVAGTTS
jgi:hypothetical protein